jgi:glycoside/pentoside/hexuronide:cation symporter, GPH family
VQPDSARVALLLGFSVVPALLMFASLPALRAFARRSAALSATSTGVPAAS